MPSLDILTLRHEPIQAFFISTSSSAIPHQNSPRTARQRASRYHSQVRVMADSRQPCDQRAVNLAFGRLLGSTINQNQTTTPPTLDPRLRNRLVQRSRCAPGSASNPVHIPDDTPLNLTQDIIVDPDNEKLQPDLGSQSNRTLPNVLHYQYPPLELQNSSAVSESPSTSSQQSHLFSTPNPYSTFQTPPSSADFSIRSGPSRRHASSQTNINGTWNGLICKRCNQRGHTAADHCKHCDAVGHVASEHCRVCDKVYCDPNRHCNVCKEIDHTSKDHCKVCGELGNIVDGHCVQCKPLSHGSHELAGENLKEETPVDQKATRLEPPGEEVQHNEAMWDPSYGWGDYSRSVNHLVGPQDGVEDDFPNNPFQQEHAHTHIRQGNQISASEQDIPGNAASDDDDSKIMPGSSRDSRDCQRNAHTEMSQTPKSFSDRQDIPQDSSSVDDGILIDPSSTPDHRDRQSSPSLEQKVHVKAEATVVQQEVESSSVAYASEDLSEDIKIPASSAASPGVQRSRSPIMTMTHIREEYVSPHLAHKADTYAPRQDGRRTPKISSQVIGNKRTRKPKSSEILVEKRQKTDTSPPKLCLATTNMPRKTIDALDEGVWLNSELHIQWKDLCYMVILEAPNHSTNLKQLHNLVTNWLRNTFPTYTSIHDRADMDHLARIMRVSPHIKAHERSKPSKLINPLDFSIRKDAIATVETMVKAFRIDLATFKYQMCMLKHRTPGTKPRPGISFENLIGMALRQARTRFLSQEQLVNWIGTDIPGYNCDGWAQGMLEELFASSFFKRRNSGKGIDQWTFRKECEQFFENKDFGRASCGKKGCEMMHKSRV